MCQCWSTGVSTGLPKGLSVSVIKGWGVKWASECLGRLPASLSHHHISPKAHSHLQPSKHICLPVCLQTSTLPSPFHLHPLSPPSPLPSLLDLSSCQAAHFSSSVIFPRVEDEGPLRSPSPGELRVLSPLSPLSPEPPGAPVPQPLQPGSLLSPPDSEAYYGETDSDADGPATQEKPRRPRRRATAGGALTQTHAVETRPPAVQTGWWALVTRRQTPRLL